MEQFLSQLLNDAPDAILVADSAGIISYWNRGAETIFGFTAAMAIGESLDLIIPEPLRARHWEGYRRVMATGATKYPSGLLTVPGARDDGTRLSLEFSIVLLRDEAGEIAGCAAIMRDVTARWQQEQELKGRLARCEKER
jgi:PAS domain S-box-containing protein